MKDLKPDEEVELIEMKVPIGISLKRCFLILESPNEPTSGTEEEAPPPGAFQYYNWDE